MAQRLRVFAVLPDNFSSILSTQIRCLMTAYSRESHTLFQPPQAPTLVYIYPHKHTYTLKKENESLRKTQIVKEINLDQKEQNRMCYTTRC